MMDLLRRLLMKGGASAFVAAAAATGAKAQEAAPTPARPANIPEGHPGEFDFLTGEWRIAHRWKRTPIGEFESFTGEATVYGILGGICSVEELRIPARDFNGLGLRLLDVNQKIWSDHWVNANSGVVTTPGQLGGFVNGEGIFDVTDMEGDMPVIYRGIWDQITANACRWRQGASRDGGATWDWGWIMEWQRVNA
ncbi:MAG: hypothetical protein JNJ63_11015 [Hyphomonadaceae bacterium]|nr:hypothetical protein [Hyphomonadaceae bacterium]